MSKFFFFFSFFFFHLDSAKKYLNTSERRQLQVSPPTKSAQAISYALLCSSVKKGALLTLLFLLLQHTSHEDNPRFVEHFMSGTKATEELISVFV